MRVALMLAWLGVMAGMTGIAQAGTMRAEALYRICLAEMVAVEAGETQFDEMFCSGYIQAAYDAFASDLCQVTLPRPTLARRFMRVLIEGPSLRQESALAVVLAVLGEACERPR